MLAELTPEYVEARMFFSTLFPTFPEVTWNKLAFIAEQYRVGEYH